MREGREHLIFHQSLPAIPALNACTDRPPGGVRPLRVATSIAPSAPSALNYLYTYNAANQRTRTTLENNAYCALKKRPPDGVRLLRVATSSAPSAASALNHLYTYNAANQRTRATWEDNAYWSYAHDALGQMTAGKKLLADNSTALGLDFAYSFDDIGNRKTATANAQLSTYTSTLLNQYLQRTVPAVLDVSGAALSGVPVAVSAGSYAALATR